MTIDFASINYLAVLTAAFATFMLGGLWYTAILGRQRLALLGWDDQKVAAAQKRMPPPVFFTIMFACYVLVALVMALLAGALGVDSLTEGLMLGAIVWAGFALAIGLTGHIAADVKHGVFGIDAAFQLIFLLLMGAIIGAWR